MTHDDERSELIFKTFKITIAIIIGFGVIVGLIIKVL